MGHRSRQLWKMRENVMKRSVLLLVLAAVGCGESAGAKHERLAKETEATIVEMESLRNEFLSYTVENITFRNKADRDLYGKKIMSALEALGYRLNRLQEGIPFNTKGKAAADIDFEKFDLPLFQKKFKELKTEYEAFAVANELKTTWRNTAISKP